VFVAGISVAITKHRLLDLRAVAAAGEKQSRGIATDICVLLTKHFHFLD